MSCRGAASGCPQLRDSSKSDQIRLEEDIVETAYDPAGITAAVYCGDSYEICLSGKRQSSARDFFGTESESSSKANASFRPVNIVADRPSFDQASSGHYSPGEEFPRELAVEVRNRSQQCVHTSAVSLQLTDFPVDNQTTTWVHHSDCLSSAHVFKSLHADSVQSVDRKSNAQSRYLADDVSDVTSESTAKSRWWPAIARRSRKSKKPKTKPRQTRENDTKVTTAVCVTEKSYDRPTCRDQPEGCSNQDHTSKQPPTLQAAKHSDAASTQECRENRNKRTIFLHTTEDTGNVTSPEHVDATDEQLYVGNRNDNRGESKESVAGKDISNTGMSQPEDGKTQQQGSEGTSKETGAVSDAAGGKDDASEKPPPPPGSRARRGSMYSSGTSSRLIVDKRKAVRRIYKNLVVLSISFFFILSSYMSLRNLQSSINAAKGLGLYGLSAVYCSLILGSLFATIVVIRMRPKRTLILSFMGFLLYNGANFYPRFYTMIPASIVIGFLMGVMWTAETSYLINIAISYSRLSGNSISQSVSKFQGIFYVFLQSSQICGGLISSLLLGQKPGHTPHDRDSAHHNTVATTPHSKDTHELLQCGSKHCPSHSSHLGVHIGATTFYALMGTFLGCTVVGTLILVFVLDPLEGMVQKATGTIKDQMTAVFRFFLQRRARCAIGLSFYSLLEMSFIFGEFTKAYVTCALGVHFVGFTMLTLAVSTGITAFVSGNLQKFVGRMPLILAALSIHFTLLLVLFFWMPTKQTTYAFFLIAATWGLGDGMLMPQLISLFGTLFQSTKEAAFSAHKMCQAVSAFVLFMTAPYLCTEVKIFIVLSVLLIALSGYITLEVLLKVQKRREQREREKEQLVLQEVVVSVHDIRDADNQDAIIGHDVTSKNSKQDAVNKGDTNNAD